MKRVLLYLITERNLEKKIVKNSSEKTKFSNLLKKKSGYALINFLRHQRGKNIYFFNNHFQILRPDTKNKNKNTTIKKRK